MARDTSSLCVLLFHSLNSTLNPQSGFHSLCVLPSPNYPCIPPFLHLSPVHGFSLLKAFALFMLWVLPHQSTQYTLLPVQDPTKAIHIQVSQSVTCMQDLSVWFQFEQNSRTFSGEIPVHCRDRKPTLISVLSVKKSAWCIQSILKRTYKIYNFLMCTLNTAVHKKININFNYCFKYKFRWELRINVYSIISWIKLWLYHWCYWWLKLQFRVWKHAIKKTYKIITNHKLNSSHFKHLTRSLIAEKYSL